MRLYVGIGLFVVLVVVILSLAVGNDNEDANGDDEETDVDVLKNLLKNLRPPVVNIDDTVLSVVFPKNH